MYITPPEVLRQSSSVQNPIVNRPTSGFYINTNATQNCNCGFRYNAKYEVILNTFSCILFNIFKFVFFLKIRT